MIGLLLLLAVLSILFAPRWSYASSWGLGWWPSGGLGTVLLVLLLLYFFGHFR